MNDKQIKEKIQSLDTLSGGIVFGKEEAWGKLQSRMEQKSGKRILVKYWLAAAAVLLLLVCITGVYYYPSKEVAKNNGEKITKPANNVAIVKPQTSPAIQQPEIREQKTVSASEHTGRPTVNTPQKETNKEQTIITYAPQIQASLNENKADRNIAVVDVSAPVNPIQKPMKTVQINELDEQKTEEQSIAVNTSPKTNFNNMPVVHINELTDNSWEDQLYMKKERFVINVRFHNPFIDQNSSNNDQNYTPHNALKFKIN